MPNLNRLHITFFRNILQRLFGENQTVTLSYREFSGTGEQSITINGIPIGYVREGINVTAWIQGRLARYNFSDIATFDQALESYRNEPPA